MARVTATRPTTRRVAGASFVDGVAETDDPGALAYFRRRPGYTVDAAPPKKRRARKPKHEQADTETESTGDGGSDGLDEFRRDSGEEVEA